MGALVVLCSAGVSHVQRKGFLRMRGASGMVCAAVGRMVRILVVGVWLWWV